MVSFLLPIWYLAWPGHRSLRCCCPRIISGQNHTCRYIQCFQIYNTAERVIDRGKKIARTLPIRALLLKETVFVTVFTFPSYTVGVCLGRLITADARPHKFWKRRERGPHACPRLHQISGILRIRALRWNFLAVDHENASDLHSRRKPIHDHELFPHSAQSVRLRRPVQRQDVPSSSDVLYVHPVPSGCVTGSA